METAPGSCSSGWISKHANLSGSAGQAGRRQALPHPAAGDARWHSRYRGKFGKMNVYVAVPLLGPQPGLPPAIFRGTCTAAWLTVAELEAISTFALTWTVGE